MSRRSGAKGHRDRTGSVFQLPDHGSGSDCGGVPQHSLLPDKGQYKLDGDLIDFDRRLGERLKALRTKRGLSLADVAAEIGISYQQLQKHEAGQNSLSTHRFLKIANVLEIGPQAILDMAASQVSAGELSRFATMQRLGERNRLLKAYFALTEEIRLIFLDLLEGAERHKGPPN